MDSKVITRHPGDDLDPDSASIIFRGSSLNGSLTVKESHFAHNDAKLDKAAPFFYCTIHCEDFFA